MSSFLLEHHEDIYGAVFFGAVIVLATWETLRPRRALKASLRTRWFGNISVIALSTLLLKMITPVTAIGIAYLMEERGWGLLNTIDLPFWLSFCVAILLLDFFRYAEHVLMHKVPLLWRIHRLHHTDQDVDFTTQFRAHPLEVLFGAGIGAGVIALLGAPVLSLIAFHTSFAAQALWTHSNIAYSRRLDQALRYVITTPEVHRIHHSSDLLESNSNLGAMLTWWDRLFGTFVEQPALGHENMSLGIAERQDPKYLTLSWMLLEPLLASEGAGANIKTGVAATNQELA